MTRSECEHLIVNQVWSRGFDDAFALLSSLNCEMSETVRGGVRFHTPGGTEILVIMIDGELGGFEFVRRRKGVGTRRPWMMAWKDGRHVDMSFDELALTIEGMLKRTNVSYCRDDSLDKLVETVARATRLRVSGAEWQILDHTGRPENISVRVLFDEMEREGSINTGDSRRTMYSSCLECAAHALCTDVGIQDVSDVVQLLLTCGMETVVNSAGGMEMTDGQACTATIRCVHDHVVSIEIKNRAITGEHRADKVSGILSGDSAGHAICIALIAVDCFVRMSYNFKFKSRRVFHRGVIVETF